ncbi:MAG: 30S ribosomal protein S27e [Nanoarchaeota archaeon]
MKNGNFIKIKCPRCKNQQIVFGKASLEVKCIQCRYLLTKTSGGKTKIRAKVEEVLCH